MSDERGFGDFGRTLREARERRGLSLRQISNATKISVSVLEALERNDISRLPGGIFSRAFVRSYATEIGLDPDTAIQAFIDQFPANSIAAGHPTPDNIEDHEAIESERRLARTLLRLIVVSVPIAGFVLYFAMTGRPAAPGSPASASAPPGEAPPGAGTLRRTEAPPVAPSAAPVESPAAAPLAAPPAPRERAAPSAPAPAAGSATPASRPVDARLTVALVASGPCWVSATVDGEKSIERLMQAGERQVLEAQREVLLTAGDAAAITLTLNGAEVRPLGKPGEVVRARFSPDNIKDYLQTP